jgi:pre-rRNA-processing protein IPI3
VTSIVADPTSNFILSGSTDSNIHVWSLPALLSFATVDTSVQHDPRSPIHTLSNHRGAITALVCGHGYGAANIAVSASADQSVIIWDYRKGIALRTYLLGDVPQVLALDSIDRGFYAAYQDGSVQLVDLYAFTGATNALYEEASSQIAVQPGDENRWSVEGQELGQALSLGLSWDGSRLLSGHQNGKIVAWDTGKGKFVSVINTLPGPVTNLMMLLPTGFPNSQLQSFKAHTVVKPRVNMDGGSALNSSMIPGSYAFTAQFTSQLPPTNFSATAAPVRGHAVSLDAQMKSDFETALTHPFFPSSMLDSGLAELASLRQTSISTPVQNSVEDEEDYMALDDDTPSTNGKGKQPTKPSTEQENELLKKQIASLQRLQKVSFQQLKEQRAEIKALVREQKEMDARLLGIAGQHSEDDEEGQRVQDDGNDGSEDEDEDQDEEMDSDMSSDRG